MPPKPKSPPKKSPPKAKSPPKPKSPKTPSLASLRKWTLTHGFPEGISNGDLREIQSYLKFSKKS